MISVVVPIYNAEKYIKSCISSIVGQENEEMEVLLIDDGSTDNSLKICQEFAYKDGRIRIITKTNSGVSDTRNRGIEEAKGEYIIFVDADDIVVKGAIDIIIDAIALNRNPDLLIWGFSTIGTRKMRNDTEFLGRYINGVTKYELLGRLLSIDKSNRLIGVIWRCAFKRSMLISCDIHFEKELRMSEDFKFMADSILAADRIAILNKELYTYRANEDSVTAKYKSNVHRDMQWINQWIQRTVCEEYPMLQVGLDCCCAETYIVTLQNMCNLGTPYSFFERVNLAWSIRKKYNYSSKLKVAIKQWKNLSMKRRIVFLLLIHFMEPIYILLFSIKRKTLLKKSIQNNTQMEL